MNHLRRVATVGLCLAAVVFARAGDKPSARVYEHRLTLIAHAKPLLADHPDYVDAIKETARFEAPALVDEAGADLEVRGWRFCYNLRGIIEVPNRLRADRTAVIVVHPWAVDDGQGWKMPEPAGVAFACTHEKNRVVRAHMRDVVNPFLKSLRGRVKLVAYSLPGKEDPIRKKLYRSIRSQPTAAERRQGAKELAAKLGSFSYRGQPVPTRLTLSEETPLADYFRQVPGLDSGDRYDPPGYWQLPIPVAKPIQVGERDVVFYDGDGYEPLRAFLKKQGVRHVLLAGYHTDMCVCSTTAGYRNLGKDFNVFLVGDATQATYPASETPAHATTAAVGLASLDLFITQVSWVRYRQRTAKQSSSERGSGR